MVSPIVKRNVFGEQVDILLASGSQCSAISEAFMIKMKGTRDDILTLPVSKMCTTTAIGARSQQVKGQALLVVNIGNFGFEIPCIVIPKLNREVVLGSDWFLKEHVKLDYDKLLLVVYERQLSLLLRDCACVVSTIQSCLNNIIHESTGQVPSMLMYDKVEPNKVLSLIEFPPNEDPRWRVCIGKNPSNFLPINAEIKKLFIRYQAPYVIARVVGPNSYLLED
nr:unnamed protein product [Callosobruchus analis]